MDFFIILQTMDNNTYNAIVFGLQIVQFLGTRVIGFSLVWYCFRELLYVINRDPNKKPHQF